MKIFRPMKTAIQNILYWSKVGAFGVVLGFSIQFAQAWTNPTAVPPNGNIDGPVTTSLGAQYKSGALGIGGLLKAYLGIDVGQYDVAGNLTGLNRITHVATPIDGKDAVNKDYVDAAGGGGGEVLIASNGAATFSASDGSDVKAFLDGGGRISSALCKEWSSGASSGTNTTSIQGDTFQLEVAPGGGISIRTESFWCTSGKCGSRPIGGNMGISYPCASGWAIYGIR